MPSRYLIAAAALVLLQPAAARACSAPPPRITVTDSVDAPVFDWSLTKAELNRKFATVKLPDAQVYHLALNAVMTGDLRADHVANLKESGDPGAVCLTMSDIAVTLRMKPVIYMASELRTKACPFKAIFEHELKHVAVDRAILQAYEPKIQNGLAFAFGMPADAAIGPVPAARAAAAKKEFAARIDGATANLFAMLMRERLTQQRQVDSLGEYAHLSNACPAGSP